MKYVVSIIRVWLSSMYLYSGFMKLMNYSTTVDMVGRYKVLPPQLNRKVGFVLPWTEIFSGIALLSGRWFRLGSTVSSLLGGSFFYASYNVLKRNEPVPCGCSGSSSSMVDQTTLRRGLVITFSSLLLLFTGGREKGSLPKLIVFLSIVLPLLIPLTMFIRRRQHNYQEELETQRKKEKIEELATLLSTQPLTAY